MQKLPMLKKMIQLSIAAMISMVSAMAMNNDFKSCLSTNSEQSTASVLVATTAKTTDSLKEATDLKKHETKTEQVQQQLDMQSLLSDIHYYCTTLNSNNIKFYRGLVEQSIVKALMSGSDVFVRSNTNGTLLFYAVYMGLSADIIQKLIRAGVPVDEPELTRKYTPLHLAVEMKAIDYIRMLLRPKSNLLETKDENGCTALHLACQQLTIDVNNDGFPDKRTYDMIFLLVLAGAKLDIRDWQWNEPLEYVPDKYKPRVLNVIKRAQESLKFTMPKIKEEGNERSFS